MGDCPTLGPMLCWPSLILRRGPQSRQVSKWTMLPNFMLWPSQDMSALTRFIPA